MIYQSLVRSVFKGQGLTGAKEPVPLGDLKLPSFSVRRKPLTTIECGYSRLVE
jgi:hypothetical protein